MPYIGSIRVFVRVMELGSITAAGRDQRLTPAVASNRIKELENRLGVRLFNRTTRKLKPTEIGLFFYDRALKILDAVKDAEAGVAGFAENPRGALRATAPLGIGRRIIAPLVPLFNQSYPDIEVRLRLSDHRINFLEEGIDVAFALGSLQDSNMKLRKIMDCRRVLCATSSYLEQYGIPETPQDLLDGAHNCLLLRFPGSQEYYWTLETGEGVEKFNVSGKFDADDGDVLTEWALAGHGIANKPYFEVAGHMRAGRLVPVLENMPPPASPFACLYPHRRLLDPKVRLFIDFMIEHCRARLGELIKKDGP